MNNEDSLADNARPLTAEQNVTFGLMEVYVRA